VLGGVELARGLPDCLLEDALDGLLIREVWGGLYVDCVVIGCRMRLFVMLVAALGAAAFFGIGICGGLVTLECGAVASLWVAQQGLDTVDGGGAVKVNTGEAVAGPDFGVLGASEQSITNWEGSVAVCAPGVAPAAVPMSKRSMACAMRPTCCVKASILAINGCSCRSMAPWFGKLFKDCAESTDLCSSSFP
jgi:hypothetical protein